MVKLKYLKIHKYRNLEPTTLTFHDGFNIILGQNGTGKTTLLNLISTILISDFSELTKEEFDIEYKIESSNSSAILTIKSEKPEEDSNKQEINKESRAFSKIIPEESNIYSISFNIEIKTPSGNYAVFATPPEITIKQDNNEIAKKAAKTQLIDKLLSKSLREVANALDKPKEERAKALSFFFDLIPNQPLRFDESLDFWNNSILKRFSRNPEEDPWTFAFRQSLSENGDIALYTHEPYTPREIISHFINSLTKNKEASKIRGLSFSSTSEGGFLKKISDIMKFKEISMKIDFIGQLSMGQEKIILEFSNPTFLFTKHDDTIISHNFLSYGQKRIFSFLYYLALNEFIVIADELVNGLHYQWIEDCLREIGDRQAFLTSQNPLLLDHLEFHDAEHVRNSFIQCRVEVQDGRERMFWENISEEDADRFYRAYEAGIQHVSEILRTKGLW